MPLKHPTETFLVFVLGVLTLVSGLVLATLPDLPGGAVPWAIAFAVALLYPLVLFPLFSRRRAEHSFRLLHWFPAAMFLIWLGLQMLAFSQAWVYRFLAVLTWGWSLSFVLLAFILLVAYCLAVIRRRTQRISLLLLAFVPFVALAIVNSVSTHWDREIAGVLWEGPFWENLENRSLLGWNLPTPTTGSSLSSVSFGARSSAVYAQNANAVERLRQRILARLGQEQSSSSPSFQPPVKQFSSSSRPSHLPQSGPGIEVFALLVVALYTGLLHDRARRRVS